ncbi:MAG: HAD family hydrolase [Deltaproteobacteria bacterium]|jgi:HAD superfamily hydrolase (TIGR01509 family)|nr:HAD family hydrolase [Deltaproteobacteria bacterium]
MLSALIFDLDMTLIDSLEACTVGANLLARKFGLPEKTESDVIKAITLPTKEFWAELWGDFREEWQIFFRDTVLAEVFHYTRLFPEAEDILRSAKSKGLLLASATNRSNPWHDLAALDIAKYFDTVVGASDVPRPKPEPDMIMAVLRQLGVEAQSAIYVGDSPIDMACAAGAGVRALGLAQGGSSPESLHQAGAAVVRPSLADSRDVLGC